MYTYFFFKKKKKRLNYSFHSRPEMYVVVVVDLCLCICTYAYKPLRPGGPGVVVCTLCVLFISVHPPSCVKRSQRAQHNSCPPLTPLTPCPILVFFYPCYLPPPPHFRLCACRFVALLSGSTYFFLSSRHLYILFSIFLFLPIRSLYMIVR